MSDDETLSLDDLVSVDLLSRCSLSIMNELFSTYPYMYFEQFPLELVIRTGAEKLLVPPTKMSVFERCKTFFACGEANLRKKGYFYSPCVELTLREYNEMKFAKFQELIEIAGFGTADTFSATTPNAYVIKELALMSKEENYILAKSVFEDRDFVDKQIESIINDLKTAKESDMSSDENAMNFWQNVDNVFTRQFISEIRNRSIRRIAEIVNAEMNAKNLLTVKNKPGRNCSSLRGCCCCMDKENVYSPGITVPVERNIIKDMISNIDEAECLGYQKGNLTKIGNTYKNLGKYDKTTWSWAPEIDIDGNPIPSRCVPTDKKSVMTVVTERTSEGDVLSQESVKLCDGDCEQLYWIVYCKEEKAYINKQNTLNRGQRIEGVLNLDLPEILSTLDEEESNLQYYTTFDEAESDFRTRKCFGIDGKAKPECSKPCDCTQQTPLGANSQVFTMVCEGDPIIKSFDFSEDEQKKQYCELVDKGQVMFISQSSDILSAYSGFIGNDSCSASNWYGISCSNGDPELITGKTYEELVKGGNAFVALYKHSSNNTEDHTAILQAVNCVNPNEQTLL